MGEAFTLAKESRIEEQATILRLRQQLWDGIKHLPGIRLNGHEHKRLAGNLNLTFAGVEGDSLLLALREIAISTTSACSAASMQPSYVLRALGLTDELAYSSIRLSIGRFTTEEQVKQVIAIICHQINRLHEISPL